MAAVSLVLGMVSIIFAFIPLFGVWVGGIIGIVGIILGALGRRDPAKRGMATYGLVCSAIGTVLGPVLFVAYIAFAAYVLR